MIKANIYFLSMNEFTHFYSHILIQIYTNTDEEDTHCNKYNTTESRCSTLISPRVLSGAKRNE